MSLLSISNVVKEFPGVRALDGVNFDLCSSEIHAICGENGAGKSTLMKILSGLYPKGSYEGELRLNGDVAEFHNTKNSMDAGIAIVYQELSLAPNLSIVENLFLGDEITHFGLLDESAMLRETQKLLDLFKIKASPLRPVSELSVGNCQLIEIAKTLRATPKILILDEPTSALTDAETQILFAVLNKLKGQGLGIIVITHRLNEIYAISDRITVLRDGRSIGTWATPQLPEEALIEAMVGRKIKDQYPKREAAKSESVMRVKGWTVRDPRNPARNVVENVSFELKQGEVLGISGLMGAGRSELLLSLFGAIPRTKGELFVGANSVEVNSPEKALASGMALVTEDRKQLGLLLESDIVTNISLASLKQISNLGVVDRNQEFVSARDYAKKLFIKTSSLTNHVKNLSGGNQQKVVIAKCLNTQPRILLMDEPTRGIDVGARQEIYQLINELAKTGLSVLVASSEIPELLGLCHRILVLCEGRLTGQFPNTSEVALETASEEKLMAAATRFQRAGLERKTEITA